MDGFQPTHRLQIGTGRKRTYWLVQVIGPIGRGKQDKHLYYNAIPSPRTSTKNRSTFYSDGARDKAKKLNA